MIRASEISKRYKIYNNAYLRLLDWLTPSSLKFYREFWALDKISFEFNRGESLGIIGTNGAGKSTLLKILCGISKPTGGGYSVDGRIASLLDLGLGFHPELSGRENIIMSARFLGLKDEEILPRLDEMIKFAELDSFIDLPIRTYSSGMYVRLGFAVAAGIDPDVLIIDEVLSVGDAYFQRKSLNRVEYLMEMGKNIVIVSHAMPIIQRFCTKTLWLHKGKMMALGDTGVVVKEYELFSRKKEELIFGVNTAGESKNSKDAAKIKKEKGQVFKQLDSRWGSGEIIIINVEMIDKGGELKWYFATGEPVIIRLHYHIPEKVSEPVFGIMIHGLDGVMIYATSNYNIDPYDFGELEGDGIVEFTLDELNLNKGTYYLSVGAYLKPDHPFWDNPSDFHNQMYEFKIWSDKIEHGYIHMKGSWRICKIDL